MPIEGRHRSFILRARSSRHGYSIGRPRPTFRSCRPGRHRRVGPRRFARSRCREAPAGEPRAPRSQIGHPLPGMRSAKQVADQMEEWFTAPACDGFVLAASSMPGAYDDVVRLLVPELQRRGLFWKEYAGPTLRDNLGLAIPRAADWHAACRAPVG